MKYPEFIKENDLIAVSAPSAGIGHHHEDYETSFDYLTDNGFRIKESEHVRIDDKRGGSKEERISEINEMLNDDESRMYMAATGGDFMYEIVNGIDYEAVTKHPKWCSGYSDPTNLLYPLTTAYDVATFYGFNASSFEEKGSKEEEIAVEYFKGNFIPQHSYETYGFHDLYEPKAVKWLSSKNQTIKGRCIGGCLEVIAKLFGTDLDKTNEFIDRYKEDGIVWYFDIFNMDALNVYLTLLQFKNAGYFRYCKGVLIGRVCFPNEEEDFTYEDAYRLGLEGIPYISEMDIGHTSPHFIMVNGAMITAETENGKGTICFKAE